jgi:hypothetical protein
MADSVVAQLVAKERPYRLRNRHLYITMSGSLKRDFILLYRPPRTAFCKEKSNVLGNQAIKETSRYPI